MQQRGKRFRGGEAADYETAQRIRERIEALEQLARDLAERQLPAIDPEQLRDLLAENALQSLVLLRDLRSSLERAGYLRGGDGTELSPRAIRRIGAQALATVYGALAQGSPRRPRHRAHRRRDPTRRRNPPLAIRRRLQRRRDEVAAQRRETRHRPHRPLRGNPPSAKDPQAPTAPPSARAARRSRAKPIRLASLAATPPDGLDSTSKPSSAYRA